MPEMPFPYYQRLSPPDQSTYRASDRIATFSLPVPDLLHPLVGRLKDALAREDRRLVEMAASYLCRGLTQMLAVAPVAVQVLAIRPISSTGELHGLYTRDRGRPPRLQVWMRTARHRRVVAFRTFLRTLLHEVGHHLDYEYLKLPDSFHTEGFFRRESSLFHQLVPQGEAPSAQSPSSR
jgi:hypothetical protein